MEEACSFTTKILKERVNKMDDPDLCMQMKHALELPLQWRIPRFEATWYMDLYERSDNMIPEVLKLAKLDFNIVQGLNQEELKELSRYTCTHLFVFDKFEPIGHREVFGLHAHSSCFIVLMYSFLYYILFLHTYLFT